MSGERVGGFGEALLLQMILDQQTYGPQIGIFAIYFKIWLMSIIFRGQILQWVHSMMRMKCHILFTCEKFTKLWPHDIAEHGKGNPQNVSSSLISGLILQWVFIPCSYDYSTECCSGISVSFQNENMDKLIPEWLVLE